MDADGKPVLDAEGRPVVTQDGTNPNDMNIKIDLSDLKVLMKQWTEDMVKALKPDADGLITQEGFRPGGRGFMRPPENIEKLAESFHGIKTNDAWQMTEQWTVVIPNYASYELAAHLRDHVYVTMLLKDAEGDQANIPYVDDVEFEILGAVGDAFAAPWTGLVASLTTTLYEAGGYYDLPYYLLERINQNLLNEINKVIANAAVRAEDAQIMTLIVAGTGTNFAGNVTRLTGAANFYASNIPSALKLLLVAGKNVRPNQCVLYLTPMAYGALLEELAASEVIAHATPSIINQGIIEKYLGVAIVVGGYRPSQQRTNDNTGTVDLCFLMRGRKAVLLAPKREILIETDKQVAERALRIVGSHTFGVRILDFKEIVRIWTSYVA